MEKDNYQLVGILNTGDLKENFVYPIFEKDGDYYFENTLGDTAITSFEKVDREEFQQNIERLGEKVLLHHPKIEYQIGDDAVIAFLEDRDHLFIGTIDQYISFYSEEKKENSFIQKSLNNMKDHRKR
ncbi:MAG: hypothetical protein IKE70_05625 [Bacilli bacterium]|nr:hypothetical protein [Bacilli bacterium]